MKSANVRLKALSKHYSGFKAVDAIDLEIRGGEFMTFLGPSGSGKTTTLKMVAGFIEPTQGEILIDDKVIKSPPHKRNIGMVFQNYALFPHMTAEQNVAFPLKMRNISKNERDRRVRQALELVQLSNRARQYPRQLSGGQQQRIALARALVFEPRVVLMDEPLGALDKKLREYLQLEIRRIQQELGLTMIYVTHDQEEALVMSDRITVFNEGKIEQVGTGEDLYEQPRTRFVADFIGESNMLEGRLVGGQLESLEGTIKTNATITAEKASLMIRPERLHLYSSLDNVPSHFQHIKAKLKNIIYLGSERKYELLTLHGQPLVARHQVDRMNREPKIQDDVSVAWDVMHGVVLTS